MTIDFLHTGLPVEGVLPVLATALTSAPVAILEAAPGAGKTTLVPLFLLKSGLMGSGKIIMLEPRRLAARAAARRMADLLGEEVGQTVGYRVRLDSKVSQQTRIEVVTEGILTRRLQSDPELKGIDLLIFDEFHERSLQTDLGLALARQVQEILRDDLKLLLMSATIDTARISKALGGAPVISSAGRQFPVETRFLSRPGSKSTVQEVLTAVEQAIQEEGDILVFLPGAREITRLQQRLSQLPSLSDILILALYGNLPPKDQDGAILPDPDGKRKIVLSTDIAETSLTIEGVRIVIDSGLARRPVFNPNSGMTALETRRIARASADQRRGRAGRLGPGICYRLWSAAEDRGLIEFAPPEITSTDLTALVLELAKWGVEDPSDLFWMDVPPRGPFAQGRDVLQALGAVDENGKITTLGQKIVNLPLHPRLGGMLLRAQKIGAGGLAVNISALLSERDIFRRDPDSPNADIRSRLEILSQAELKGGKTFGAAQQVRRTSQDLRRRLKIPHGSEDQNMAGLLLAFAYPDRIGELRSGSQLQYRLSGGRGARLMENDRLQGEPYLVVADLDGKGREARIDLAAPISVEEIEENFADMIVSVRRVFWDEKKSRVLAVLERKLGALLITQQRIENPAPEEVEAALLTAVKSKGLKVLPWNEESRSLAARINFVRYHETEEGWPDLSDTALVSSVEDWLLPYLAGASSLDDLQKINLTDILLNLMSRDQRKQLEEYAPPAIKVPSGSYIRLNFNDPESPVLAARLQELFGLQDVPKLCNGRVSVSIHLLSPARRPVQITQDLASFWKNTYTDVKKDLKGRYPKHYWPDDPLEAEATSRVKPRRSQK
ncbi:ATP-dependent helicase HrpB [uncultured Sneathiella sp.]|uniref:ATP-dependent helicase HrpB n=1 Tax=uncultured Sneathiella sp. TaxID=879315 RepID=UPI0030DD5F14